MTSRRKWIVAAAVLGIGAGITLAQDDARPRRLPPQDGEGRARMIEQFDTDGDGRLSENERAAAREQRRADRPGLGRGQAGDRPRAGMGRGGERLGPRDGSGAGLRGEGPRDGRGPGRRSAGFRDERRMGPRDGLMAIARFDVNNDGKLSDDELEALRTAYEARHQELLQEFDTDGDGQLSPEERRAAFGSRRRPRNPEAPAAVEADDTRPQAERRDRPRRRMDR